MSNPQQIVTHLKLQPGMHVADFGAGAGFYTFAAAKIVGPKGKIYAVDVLKDLLLKLRNEAGAKQLSNVEIIWGDIEKSGGSKLAESSMDAVILANTLFQLEDKSSAIEEIRRIVKPGGKVLLVDWSESFSQMGPDVENVVTRDRARSMFEESGFALEEETDAGEHHYALIFSKK